MTLVSDTGVFSFLTGVLCVTAGLQKPPLQAQSLLNGTQQDHMQEKLLACREPVVLEVVSVYLILLRIDQFIK